MANGATSGAKVPDEAKAFTELLVWAGQEGHGGAVKTFIEAADSGDWSSALEASRQLERYAELAEHAESFGRVLDVADKVNKALEIGAAVQNGEYEYAAARLGAEAVDQIASGYLDSLGPGGVAIDYATHVTGDYLSGLMDEYQQAQNMDVEGQADINASTVSAWQYTRDWVETEVQRQLETGKSPDEVSDWAREHLETHRGVYDDLERMEGLGPEQYARLIKDQDWIVERTYDIWEALPPDVQGPLRSGESDADASAADVDHGEFDVALLDQERADATSDAPVEAEAGPEGDAGEDSAVSDFAVAEVDTEGDDVVELALNDDAHDDDADAPIDDVPDATQS